MRCNALARTMCVSRTLNALAFPNARTCVAAFSHGPVDGLSSGVPSLGLPDPQSVTVGLSDHVIVWVYVHCGAVVCGDNSVCTRCACKRARVCVGVSTLGSTLRLRGRTAVLSIRPSPARGRAHLLSHAECALQVIRASLQKRQHVVVQKFQLIAESTSLRRVHLQCLLLCQFHVRTRLLGVCVCARICAMTKI